MILAASLVCHNELSRYLEIVIDHLREFADQITVMDDGSTDGTLEYLQAEADEQLWLAANPTSSFDMHEGRTRQMLLDVTLARNPSHVLALDLDELIEDGLALRRMLHAESDVPAWSLTMSEVWRVDQERIHLRTDGAWRPYERVQLWKVPQHLDANWRIDQRQLACSPVPGPVRRLSPRSSGQALFHFGWADPTTRQARYDRYMRLDGGRFHAGSHLRSIMLPEDKIRLAPQSWPKASWKEAVRDKLLAVR